MISVHLSWKASSIIAAMCLVKLLVQVLGCRTCDRRVVGSTPRQFAIKLLLLEWVTVCGQPVNYVSI